MTKQYAATLDSAAKKRVVTVRARCIGCGNERDIAAGEVPNGEQPVCNSCLMPMVAVHACAAYQRRKK